MKKLFNKVKKSIFFYTIAFICFFVIEYFFLGMFNITFRRWVYYAIIILSVIGIISGIIQNLIKKDKRIKIIFSILSLIMILFVIVFWKVILIILAFSYKPEHVIEKDGKKYVAYVESFLKVDVYYYDYINLFLVGNKVKIYEKYGNGGYDPFDGKHENAPLEYYYYDKNGEVISTNDPYYNKLIPKDSKVYDKSGNLVADLSKSESNTENDKEYVENLTINSLDDFYNTELTKKNDIRNLVKEYDLSDAQIDNCFVIGAMVHNDNLYHDFMENYNNKKSTFIRVAQKDVVLYDVLYYKNDGKLYLVVDNTRDKSMEEIDRKIELK